MKFLRNSLYVLLAAMAVSASSCAEQTLESYNKYENIALKAWIDLYRPELKDNFQEEGGYYVEVVDDGTLTEKPIGEEEQWVRFAFTGRDLSGNIALTRQASDAIQEGTFTKFTRYVPLYRFCGEQNSSLLEGTYRAMRNKLKIGDQEFRMRIGSRVRLYMPSSVVGSGGLEGSGGYEGQYSLSAKRPMIVDMTITDTVKNPLQREGSDVDAFCDLNGKYLIYSKDKNKTEEENKLTQAPTDLNDPRHPYISSERWVSACDSVPQLYVNYRYTPTGTFKFDFSVDGRDNKPYFGGYEPYVATGSMAEIDQKIADALKKRFYPDADKQYVGIKDLKADSVKLEGTAKIWYIGRFLDGFIFDTNIDEVKKIIYGKVEKEGTALSYTPQSGGLIQAFYYTVPNLQYGQWAAFVTTSTNAYGASGKQGGTSSSSSGSTSSGYYDYLNYQGYMNSYYGNSGYYDGYYNDYYGMGGYGGGYYGGFGSNYGETTTETTTQVSTEVPAFSPLIFQFYIEPKTK